jgi:tRNA(adenine34) deaminase
MATNGSRKSKTSGQARSRKDRKKRPRRKTKKWSGQVKTVSTFPPEGTFTKDAKTIARVMASKKVSPKGIGSGIKMIQFFINRAGKDLPPGRKRELEKAKRILREKCKGERATRH